MEKARTLLTTEEVCGMQSGMDVGAIGMNAREVKSPNDSVSFPGEKIQFAAFSGSANSPELISRGQRRISFLIYY